MSLSFQVLRVHEKEGQHVVFDEGNEEMATETQRDTELTKFFELISDPMRQSIQRELFTNVLREKNTTIADTIHTIVTDKGDFGDQSPSASRGKKVIDFGT